MDSIPPKPVPYRLDGKVALVTGSGRGIGAAMAVELARCGAKVVVNYANSSGPAEKLVEEIKSVGSDAIALKADVSQVKQTIQLFDEAVKHFGQLDIVCSNAGVVSFGHLEEVTEEEFDRVFSINTRAQFFVAREAYKHLNVGGRIILMSSNTTKDFIVPRHSVYSGSKGAIESFVRVLALDCGKKKITVNAVAPGGIVTDMFHAVARNYIPHSENLSDAQVKEGAAHASPLIRCGYPIDVAHVVCFLASKEGEWINGKVMPIDGGAA
ncbi:Short chain dehydrogenase AgnL6 [Trapelia coarctata]|nr:Short chain dehydrogenase AgnL6 [Trapelia coarctata]